MKRAFFFVGNKRSGTSLLVRLLNLHPEVFCSHESDIAWILYSMFRDPDAHSLPTLGDKGWIEPHLRDDYYGMRCTLESVGGGFLDGRGVLAHDPVETFFQVQANLMEQGSKIQDTFDKPDAWLIGDKKPVQCADPDVRRWIDETFEDVRYLHVVRHPRNCISSMHELGLVPWWENALELVEQMWADHERWALSIPSSRRLTLRYEDLVDSPERSMGSVFRFLGVDAMSTDMIGEVQREVKPQNNRTLVDIPYTQPVRLLMETYGYEAT